MSLLSIGRCGAPQSTANEAMQGFQRSPDADFTLSPPEAAARSSRPAAPWSPTTPNPLKSEQPTCTLSSAGRTIALTLDDGPDPLYTPTVLALLRKYQIRATFCLVGENAAAHLGLVREIAADGHQLANHTWTHADLRHLPAGQVCSELERTSDLLQEVTDQPLDWFRAPGGDWAPGVLRTCAQLGMRPLGWSVDPRDWARPGISNITRSVLSAVRPGSIVLNHDGGGDRAQTVAALRLYLPQLLERGYTFAMP